MPQLVHSFAEVSQTYEDDQPVMLRWSCGGTYEYNEIRDVLKTLHDDGVLETG